MRGGPGAFICWKLVLYFVLFIALISHSETGDSFDVRSLWIARPSARRRVAPNAAKVTRVRLTELARCVCEELSNEDADQTVECLRVAAANARPAA